jgi:hypothetical protein
MDLTLAERLICPLPHERTALVVRADRVANGRLIDGLLGCPVCHGEWPVRGGVARFGPPSGVPAAHADADVLAALLGLVEPGRVVIADGVSAPVSRALALRYGAIMLSIDASETNDPTATIEGAARVPIAPGSAQGAALLREREAAFVTSAAEALAASSRIVSTLSNGVPHGVAELARDDVLWVGAPEPASLAATQPVTLRRAGR